MKDLRSRARDDWFDHVSSYRFDTRISDEAKASAKEYIEENYGKDYVAQTAAARKDNKKFRTHMRQFDLLM